MGPETAAGGPAVPQQAQTVQAPTQIQNAQQVAMAPEGMVSGNGPTQIPMGPETAAGGPAVVTPPPKPRVPLVVNAANPAETSNATFNSMLQAESGGKHYDKNGNVITSPAGALGIAQIMPATAAQPGFGVKPISPEDLKDPAKNAAFGLKLFTGLNNYYNGNEEKAVAAYNAGAGNVNKALLQAQQQGGDYKDYLPKETQDYVAKVMANKQPVTGDVAAHVEQVTGQPYSMEGQGFKLPGGYTMAHYDALNSKDPEQLMKLAYGLTTPPAIAKQAIENLHDDIKYQQTMANANAKVDQALQTGDVNKVLSESAKKGEEGSFFKAILYARLGLKDLAEKEQEKISPTKTTLPVMLGNDHYSATYDKYGNLLSARDEKDNLVDKSTLAKIAANSVNPAQAKAFLMPGVHGTPVTKTINGQLVNGIQVYDPLAKQFYVQYGNQQDRSPAGWTPATQNVEQAAAVAGTKATAAAAGRVAGNATEYTGGGATVPTVNIPGKPAVATAPQVSQPAAPGAAVPQVSQPAAVVQPTPQITQPQAAVTTPNVAGKPQVVNGQLTFTNSLPPDTSANVGGTVAEMKRNSQRIREDEQLFGKNKQGIIDVGSSAQDTANLRRQMATLLLDPASPIGMATGQNDSPKLQLFNDIMAGQYSGHPTELGNALVAAQFKPGSQAYNNVVQFANLAGQINAQSGQLKQEFGGRVSNMEVSLFNKTTGGDMLRSPAYALFATNENNTINNDLANAKGDLASSERYRTSSGFNTAWKAQKETLEDTYAKIKEARLQYIQSLPGGVSQPNNVRAGFQAYPTPQYDTRTQGFVLSNGSKAVVQQNTAIPADNLEKLKKLRSGNQ